MTSHAESRKHRPIIRAGLVALSAALMLSACSEDSMVEGANAMKAGDYASAVIHFRSAVQKDPDSAKARLALADALEKVNDSPGVESNLRKALDSDGSEAELAPRIAFLMLEANNVDKLVSEFSGRRLQDPVADSNLRAVVAMALLAQRNSGAAASQLQNVQPTAAVHLARSQLLLAEGKRKEALAELNEPAAGPDAPWWILRATSRLASLNGQAEQGLAAIKRAHELAPWSNALVGEYAEALLNSGKFDEAKALQGKLKKGVPGYFWTQYIDARLLARDGRIDDAMTAALRVLQASPDHLPANMLVAAAELQRNEAQSAYRRLQNITAKYPSALDALALMAEAQQKLGLVKEADDTVRKGLAMAPDSVRMLSLRADVEIRQNQLPAAAATLAQLVQKDPQNASYLLRLAEVKGSLRDKTASNQLLDQSAALLKGDAATFDRVIATALRMNNVAAARRLADRAIADMPKEPQTRLSLAAVQAAQQDNDGAWKSTLEALDLKPAFQPALAALGAMVRKPAQRQELLKRYEKALKAGSAEATTYLQYAEWSRRMGDEAKLSPTSILEQGVTARPDSIALRTALVEMYMQAGVQDKALSTAQGIAAMPGSGNDGQLLLASTYQRVGQVEAASGVYRKLSAVNPDRPDWRLKVANLEVDAGRPNEAINVLKSLIANQPDYADAYVMLGRLLVSSNPADAVAVARQMAARPALSLNGQLLQADLLAMAQKPEDALAQYAAAAKAGALPDALLGRVAVNDRLGKTAAAEADLAEALRRFPKHPNVLGLASQRALVAGQAAKGVDYLKRIVELDPRNPIALNDLAWAQVQAGQPQALDNARKALELMPDHPVVLDTLGMALKLAGRHDEAVKTLQTAVNIAPSIAATRLHLAQALQAAGKKSEAAAVAKSITADRLNAGDRAALEKLSEATKG